MTPGRVAPLLGALALAAGCGEGPEDVFRREAMPVLESRCASASCHGVAAGESYPASDWLFFLLDERGAIASAAQAREAALGRAVTSEPAGLSSLVRLPTPAWAGGGPHAGGALFSGLEDPARLALVRWLDAEPDGTGGEDVALTEREQLFGQTVLPELVARCGFAGCHAPTEVANTSFPARPDPETGRFAPEQVRAAYKTARKFLNLWGSDPADARLIGKAIGEIAGGLGHRGGDTTFFPEAPFDRPLDAPGLRAILEWSRLEREALGVVEDQAPTGMLFVRGPAAPRAPYRIEAGPLGSDLYLAAWPPVAGAEENLTSGLHPTGPAEVRDPAVSHDAQRVAFAMRRDGEARFSLWELELDDRSARRVSPEGAEGSYVQPAYLPDGRIVAAWDGHGEAGVDGAGVPPELIAIDAAGGEQRLTFTPAPEMSPAMLAAGKTRGGLIFGIRRDHPLEGTEGVLFRFPLCHDDRLHGEPEYHVHFGASIAPHAPLVARDLPDGRQVVIVLGSTGAADDRGRLALLDRSLGPVLRGDPSDASVAGYRPALAWLDLDLAWRDPAPLPDGTFLVARDDPAAPGQDAIYRVTVADGGGGATLGSAALLLSSPGDAMRSPVPIFARPVEDDGHEPVIDTTQDQGFLTLRDVATLEALYGVAEPRGVRVLRDEIRGVRLLSWEGARAAALSGYPDGGNTVGLTGRAPRGVLAEHALPADRSAWIEIPARMPILLQFLDERGMAVGRQLDRWFYAEGAESVPGGTNSETYAHNCAGCHGSLSGRPEDAAAPPPDSISAASVTLSTHRNRDRRHPLSPAVTPMEGTLVDFASTVGPVLEERCAIRDCHGGDAPAGALPLDQRAGTGRFPAAYEALLSRYVDAAGLRARASPLVERLVGEELDAPAPLTGSCPPEGADEALLRDVVRWIELGAFYDAAAREGD